MSKVKDGLVQRGRTWSYVVRVTDPTTGISKPKWVGGYATEVEAKAARDEARVAARHGGYIDRSAVTVAEYLREWLDGHAVTVKPKTVAGYRFVVERYVVPRIGRTRLQSLRPATVSALYRDLLTSGGRDGGPLSQATVALVHRTLRKALNDAVKVERLIPANPVERAKRPKAPASVPGEVWTPEQVRTFLATAASHRLGAFFHLAVHTGMRRGELLALRCGTRSTSTRARSRSPAPRPSSRAGA